MKQPKDGTAVIIKKATRGRCSHKRGYILFCQ
jgi:hypothetical protein